MTTATMSRPATPTQGLIQDEPLYEVIRGQRVELPPMSSYAVLVASRLQNRLGPFVEQHQLGFVITEGLFIFDVAADTRRRPDVAFVSANRWPLTQPIPLDGDLAVVPDLAVEVVSLTDRAEELQEKVVEYFARGVVQVWVIYPKIQHLFVYDSPTRVTIHPAADTLQGLPLFPGFTLLVADLFPPVQLPSPVANGPQAP